MIERLLILLIVLFVLWGGVCIGRWVLARRARTLAGRSLPAPLAALLDGRPALLYFTAAHCAQCRLQQTPILQQLAASVDVAVHTIDAVEQAELATHFGVMTVPTTVLIDRSRRAAAVNHGVTPLARLREQLAGM